MITPWVGPVCCAGTSLWVTGQCMVLTGNEGSAAGKYCTRARLPVVLPEAQYSPISSARLTRNTLRPPCHSTPHARPAASLQAHSFEAAKGRADKMWQSLASYQPPSFEMPPPFEMPAPHENPSPERSPFGQPEQLQYQAGSASTDIGAEGGKQVAAASPSASAGAAQVRRMPGYYVGGSS